jgi:hypothetical protein
MLPIRSLTPRIECTILTAAGIESPSSDLANIIQHEWSTRLWTVQEYILATRPVVMCRTHTVPWKDFQRFSLSAISAIHGDESCRSDKIVCLERWRLRELFAEDVVNANSWLQAQTTIPTRSKEHLLILLTRLSQVSSCSEPADRVYAFYSVIFPFFSNLPELNYDQSFADIIADFTRATIMSTGKFWPSITLHWRSLPTSQLPTWTPDLAVLLDMRKLWSTVGLSEMGECKAAGDSNIHLESLCVNAGAPRRISLKGIALTQVATMSDRWPVDFDKSRKIWLKSLLNWLVFCANLTSSAINNNSRSIFEALSHIIVMDQIGKRHARGLEFLITITTWFMETWEHHLPIDVDFVTDRWHQFLTSPDGSLLESHARMVENLSDTVHNLSDTVLFTSSANHLGNTIGFVQPGDTVVLLAGSEWPVLLREKENGCWRCIGSAYIHGIMNGEAWPKDTNLEKLKTYVLV